MAPIEKTDKRAHILTVAEQLFAEQGFDGTSVRDIAQGANVNLAMISYYFGSKEKLLEALIEEYLDQLARSADSSCAAQTQVLQETLRKVSRPLGGKPWNDRDELHDIDVVRPDLVLLVIKPQEILAQVLIRDRIFRQPVQQMGVVDQEQHRRPAVAARQLAEHSPR